jgi:hypothetical protein
MRRMLICAALLFAAVPAWAGDPEMEAAIDEIYAPYFADSDDLEASLPAWERPIFSNELQALVSRWRANLPETEADDLSGADWLCMCQDWDPGTFSTEVIESAIEGDAATAKVRIIVFPGAQRIATFRLLREDEGWKIDELTAPDFPEGLRAALRKAAASGSRR